MQITFARVFMYLPNFKKVDFDTGKILKKLATCINRIVRKFFTGFPTFLSKSKMKSYTSRYSIFLKNNFETVKRLALSN